MSMYKLSPSKAHRYLNCTKSLEFDTEFVETPWTIRGNILHKYAEMLINEEDTSDFVKENNFSDYEEFLISSYINAVRTEYELIQAYKLQVEQRKSIKIYDNDINLVIDTLILSRNTASIIDLKTGNNDIEVFDNEQLMFYAYAICLEYPKIKYFRLSIFQKGKLKSFVTSRSEVFDYFISKYEVFEKIKEDKLEYNPSEKACKYCGHRDQCVARAEWILGGKK